MISCHDNLPTSQSQAWGQAVTVFWVNFKKEWRVAGLRLSSSASSLGRKLQYVTFVY